MGRPPLPVGTHGKIGFSVEPGPPQRVRARVHFRDLDGVVRQVTKFGPSKAAAERALKIALRDRITPGQSDITAAASVEVLARRWLAELPADRRASTRQTYLYALDNYIVPTLGALRVREVGTPAVDRALKEISSQAGPGAAKTARSVLSGMLRLAVRHGAISANPVREAAPIRTPRKSAVHALSKDEVDTMTRLLHAHERAVELDIPDLVDFMLATGVRIGEALAVRSGTNTDGEALLDLVHNTVEINATIVRIKGKGLTIQAWPKTAAGWRRLALPPYASKIIERRSHEPRRPAPGGVVFGSLLGHLRDPSNTAGDIREVLDGIGCPKCQGRGWFDSPDGKRARCDAGPFSWVTSHVFRKTVATRLDEAGLSARQIADQLGHAHPSITQDVYMGRKVVTAEAATLLDRKQHGGSGPSVDAVMDG
ncbi:MAG TPA: tyrosine-type recombinase/integrase [Nocardioidaceae bacterium]|nr:tyrosine-type recombinase/integrase [Nocardioidaceae bacterium]